ncbi:serine/threonine-protein kinase [Sorangium sp. So ce887]|uniref:serine/threonine-protein kinase n=1 Tax=Sorangium sp. So ce887 TaxID=3133324 RepID=UPI003F63EDC7
MASEESDTLPSAGIPIERTVRSAQAPTAAPADADTRLTPSTPTLTDMRPPAGALGDGPSLDDLSPGARAGDWVTEGRLGAGGFSVIYRARHAERGTPAAVKVLHPELSVQPDVVIRFQREVETVRRLEHPGIVQVFEQGQLEDGRPYYVMELLTGVSLDQHLRSRGRLSPDETLALLEPLCDALEAAHALAVVHRDLKASNVFLEEGGRRRVVLLDFGVAKLLDAPGPALTTSREVIGSPSSVSPEQLLGQPVDLRADVYALGALAYRMLVGEPLFSGDIGALLRQLHLFASPPRPSAKARLSPGFDEVILRALAKDPEARYPTAGAFLEDFRGALEASRGGSDTPSGGRARPGVAVYAEVGAAPEALDAPDDRLLADLEAILPFVAAELTEAGLSPAAETGNSLLFSAERPDDAADDAEARRRAVDAALWIFRRLEGRPGRDPRVQVRLCIHTGELLLGPSGELLGGSLAEVGGWAPEGTQEGVFASPEALAGLGIVAGPMALEGAMLVLAGAEPAPAR